MVKYPQVRIKKNKNTKINALGVSFWAASGT